MAKPKVRKEPVAADMWKVMVEAAGLSLVAGRVLEISCVVMS